MKKTIFASISAVLFAGSLSAQMFVGGSFGFDTYSSSTTANSNTQKNDSKYGFGITPYGGFYLNDDMAVGAELGLNFYGGSNNAATETTWSQTMFSITPFFRYHLLEISNVTLMGQAGIGLGFGGVSSTTSGTTTDVYSQFDFTIGIRPVISYDFSESIAIEAFLGRLSFENNSKTYPANGNNSEKKVSENTFELKLSTGLGLGFVYKF